MTGWCSFSALVYRRLVTLKAHWKLLCVVLLAFLSNAPARGENYPSRSITIVVSLAAGSGMDSVTRLYADKLSEAFGKPVIVENKPGAGTTLAANQVAKVTPDGYTLVVLTSIARSINPTYFERLNYEPQDFTPISLYVKSPFVLVINPTLPAKTLEEFVELARTGASGPNSGKVRARRRVLERDGVRLNRLRIPKSDRF
jgi:tripartite-type tricarboxylate transporter receptor subunit TctC